MAASTWQCRSTLSGSSTDEDRPAHPSGSAGGCSLP